MKRKLIATAVAGLMVCGFCLPSFAQPIVGDASSQASSSPTASSGEEALSKERITVGYCAEDYIIFDHMLESMAQSFYDLGMLTAAPPPTAEGGRESWRFIGSHLIEQEALVFDENHYYNLSAMSAEEIDAMMQQTEVDLMLVMGSVAAGRFIEAEYQGDYIVAGVNDVYRLGAIEKESDSGYSNRCAAIYNDVYDRQIDMLCNTFAFEKIGIVYQNTPQAAEYSGVAHLRELSKEQGFVIEERYINEPASYEEYPAYVEGLKALYEELAPMVDVFYLSINLVESKDIGALLEPFYTYQVPIISQRGMDEVECGALFGINMTDEANYGRMLGEMIIDYLSGKPIRYMSRVFRNAPIIYINREAAQRLGYTFDIDTLLACDEVYNKIKTFPQAAE